MPDSQRYPLNLFSDKKCKKYRCDYCFKPITDWLKSTKLLSVKSANFEEDEIYTNTLAKLDFAINSVGKETNCILSVSKKRLQEEDGI